MGKAVVKKKKNYFKSLTKRQKIILAGVSAGLISLVIIVIIFCLWPREEKRKQNISGEMKAGHNLSEASRRNEPGVGRQARKILGAKTLVPYPPPASDSQEKSEDPGESNETLTKTEKASKKTSEEAPKVTPDLIETKAPITPVKEIQKKQPTVSLKTCADYQSALSEALKKNNKKTDFETLYAKVQELCKGTFITQTLDEHVKQQFEARKAQIFASECPTNNDFSELMVLQSNLKALDNTYVPVKTLEQEFCDYFGNRFTVPFGKVEIQPDIVDGKDCALEAQKYFHAARTFGKNNHPSYAHEDLEKYVTAKVEEHLNPLNADVMKYIQILRYLNSSSPYAFPDCNDLAALQIKIAGGKTAAESINIFNGPLCMEIVRELADNQIELLIERCSDFLNTPPADQIERYAAESNKSLLELVKFVKGMDESAHAWMNSGFHVRKSPDFQTFAKKQLTLADRSKLTQAMDLANLYHHNLNSYLSSHGLTNDAEKHQLDGELACFLKEAFVSTDQNVLKTIMEFSSADTLESVDGFVTFFEDNTDLRNHMVNSLLHTRTLFNKHAGIYRLIQAQINERTIPKAVPGVNMNAPKDAKEWFKRMEENSISNLAPVLNIAKNKEEATAAKNDMLPDGEKESNDEINSVFRPVAVLWEMQGKAGDIQRQFNDHVQTLGIPADIRTALVNIESYVDQPEFYKFLKTNQKNLEYSVHGFDSEHAIQDVTKYITQGKEILNQSKLYKNVSLIISIFDKDADGCVLQADGTISCQNKYMENKLRELEKDATWDGHIYLNQFLSDARNLNSVDDVRNMARTFLAAEKADCDAIIKQHFDWFGHYLTRKFKFNLPIQ